VSTPFTDAVQAFIVAERSFHAAHAPEVSLASQRLAHAGDVLEREMRAMMRDVMHNPDGKP
jgi:hypothetical protein